MLTARTTLDQMQANLEESMGVRDQATDSLSLSPMPRSKDLGRRPHTGFGTVAIDRVEFQGPAHDGDLLRFHSHLVHIGRSSLTTYTEVDVMPATRRIFQAYVTYVALNRKGRPTNVAALLLRPFRPETKEDRRRWQEVEDARRLRQGN